MAIDKKSLFESTRSLWPLTIDLSDPDATYRVYWGLEQAHSEDDDWQQLALWSFHQALGVLERSMLASGPLTISPDQVTFGEFDTWMRRNLSGDACWASERAEYDAS